MKPKQEIQVKVIPASVFSIQKGRKYILLFPTNYQVDKISKALQQFLGDNAGFIIVATPETIDKVKVLEIE